MTRPRVRFGPLTIIWTPAPSGPVRRAASAVAGVVVAAAAAHQLRVPPAAPAPTLEQRRVLVAAAQAADPGLADLTGTQLDRLARQLCLALDRGGNPAHPTLTAAEAAGTGIFALAGDSYDTATALAAAAYCPVHLAAVRSASP